MDHIFSGTSIIVLRVFERVDETLHVNLANRNLNLQRVRDAIQDGSVESKTNNRRS